MCNLCGRDVKMRTTTHMIKHLRNHHGERCYKLFRQLDTERFDARNYLDGEFEIIENPTLVEPEKKPFTKFGKYLNHFMLYCIISHPMKKNIARCNLCSRDILHNRSGVNLHEHIFTWHKQEYQELNIERTKVAGSTPGTHQPKKNNIERLPKPKNVKRPKQKNVECRTKRNNMESSTKQNNIECQTTTNNIEPSRATHSSNIETNEKRSGSKTGKDSQDKYWFESWEKTRTALNQARRDLKEESDEEIREDFQVDIKKLRKRKAEYEVLLGMNE